MVVEGAQVDGTRSSRGDAMSDSNDRAADAARSRLDAAGIDVTDEELAVAADVYRFYRSHVHLLYEAPEVRYSEPALMFRAAPPLDDWTG
jgi:hypothetical protein